MKKHIATYALLICLAFPAIILAQHAEMPGTSGTDGHKMLNENNLTWKAGPASLPPGAQMAMLEGDPAKAGPFTMRLILPSNYRVGPHFHPAVEHVSVIKGNFYMGTGKEFKEDAATRIKANGFAVMPVGYAHYAFTRGKTIIQLHGVGPWGITYINDADDPRKK
jgi:hypothetical protein